MESREPKTTMKWNAAADAAIPNMGFTSKWWENIIYKGPMRLLYSARHHNARSCCECQKENHVEFQIQTTRSRQCHGPERIGKIWKVSLFSAAERTSEFWRRWHRLVPLWKHSFKRIIGSPNGGHNWTSEKNHKSSNIMKNNVLEFVASVASTRFSPCNSCPEWLWISDRCRPGCCGALPKLQRLSGDA